MTADKRNPIPPGIELPDFMRNFANASASQPGSAAQAYMGLPDSDARLMMGLALDQSREKIKALEAQLELMGRALNATIRTLQTTEERLEETRNELKQTATIDRLTGVKNRVGFEQALDLALADERRFSSPKSATPAKGAVVLMMDLDGFKEINDRLGHPAGDLALKQFASELTKLLRHHDSVCRFGGDEFAVVLPHTSLAEVLPHIHEIEQKLGKQQVVWGNARAPFGVTFVGIEVSPTETEHLNMYNSAGLQLDGAKFSAVDINSSVDEIYQAADAVLVPVKDYVRSLRQGKIAAPGAIPGAPAPDAP